MNNQFKFLNKGISTNLAIFAIIFLTVLLIGGILIYQYWWLPNKHVFPIPAEEVKTTQGQAIDLSAKLRDARVVGARIWTVVYAPSIRKIYLGGLDSTFYEYNPSSGWSGVTTDLTPKISSIWSKEQICSLVFDSTNHTIYLGGGNGKFAKYNPSRYNIIDPTSYTATDLTPKISSFWGKSDINALAFDSTNNTIYLGGTGRFAQYDPATDRATDLTSKISSFWKTRDINALAFDLNNKTIYIGGERGSFAKYNPSTDKATDLSSKIPFFWSKSYRAEGFDVANINALLFNSNSNTIYLGGDYFRFAQYDPAIDRATDLRDKISSLETFSGLAHSDPGHINALSFDQKNNVIYLIRAHNGNFAKYNPSTDKATDLTSKISSFWGKNDIRALTFDSTNKNVYLVSFGKFARYSSLVDAATDISSKIYSYDYGATFTIGALTFDPNNDIVYLAGAGRLVKYDSSTDTIIDLTSKISSFWGKNDIRALTFDSTNNILYLGGYFKFAKYDASTDTATDLTSKIAFQYIYSLIFDPDNNIIYLGGVDRGGGRFAKYDPSTDTVIDLSSKVPSFSLKLSLFRIASSAIRSLVFNSTDSTIYLGGDYGDFGSFGKYNPSTGTATDLTSKISSFWGKNDINFLTFDSADNIVYLAGSDGKFAKYDLSTNRATNLTNKLSFFRIYIEALIFDSNNNIIYSGGGLGRFAKYDPSTNRGTDLTSKISSFWGEGTINALIFDPTNNIIYLGGYDGRFAKYLLSK